MTSITGLTSGKTTQETGADNDKVFRRIAIYFSQLNPTGTLSFLYLTEGAANVVWKIHFQDSNLSNHDSSAVLRMRKDIPSTISMTELKQQFEGRIAPLFLFDPSLLLPVQLIELNPAVIANLNEILHQLEETRHRKSLRVGVYHPIFETEPYAMIMPNLYNGLGKVIEFKPKWLSQSPSAPRDAQRCRTCALNAMRRLKGGTGRGDSGFCPFDLLSLDNEILSGALRQVWDEQDSLLDFIDAFRFTVQPALRQLQKLQRLHHEVGLEDFRTPEGKDFSVAMALRDCSVLLKVVRYSEDTKLDIPIVKLLDLDLKDTGGGKLAKWATMESELIEEGWYLERRDSKVRCAMAFQ